MQEQGDRYIRIRGAEEHNLDCCRTQMAPVESIETRMDAMMKAEEKY